MFLCCRSGLDAMYILALMIITALVCIVLMKKVDHQRWHRYQIERDLYFRNHPYELKTEQDFNLHVTLTKSMQFKLINELMLKSFDEEVYRRAIIQRERIVDSQSPHYMVKVKIADIDMGYLERNYAEQFCKSLKKSDFFIGRPISILSEIMICRNRMGEAGCRVKLGLPEDPDIIKELIFEKK